MHVMLASAASCTVGVEHASSACAACPVGARALAAMHAVAGAVCPVWAAALWRQCRHNIAGVIAQQRFEGGAGVSDQAGTSCAICVLCQEGQFEL